MTRDLFARLKNLMGSLIWADLPVGRWCSLDGVCCESALSYGSVRIPSKWR